MPSLETRLTTLEKRQPARMPHGMTDKQLTKHLSALSPRDLQRFVTSLTDADLSASIDLLTSFEEQTHDNA
jgi:hypothetical protein